MFQCVFWNVQNFMSALFCINLLTYVENGKWSFLCMSEQESHTSALIHQDTLDMSGDFNYLVIIYTSWPSFLPVDIHLFQ